MKASEAAVLARAAILLAALAVPCLLLAGCGSKGPGTASTAPTPTASGAAVSSGRSVFGRALRNPAVSVTGGQLYVAWQVNQASARVPRFELVRAD
jgi:hypothetical protein